MIHPTRLVLCLFAAAACSGTGASSDGAIGAATAMPDTQPKTDRAIPSIDAEAPAACQTATFALG
jgi:hypothetical protein